MSLERLDRTERAARIRRFLGGVGRRLRLREFALAAIALANVVGLLVVLGLPETIHGRPQVRLVYLAVIAVALLVTVGFIGRRLLARRNELDVATWLTRSAVTLAPGPQRTAREQLGDRLRSALELGAELPGLHAPSPVLVGLHTEAVADEVAGLEPRRFVEFDALVGPARLLAVLALTLVAVAALFPAVLPSWWRAMRTAPPSASTPPRALVAGFQPVLGQLRLTYRYPAYSGLEPRVVEGATGDIRALRGTEVVIEGRTDLPVAAASLELLPDGELALEVVDGRSVRGAITVLDSGTWQARFVSATGAEGRDPLAHVIAVDEDRPPAPQLLEPAEDGEVDELVALSIAWQASDDFGLEQVDLVVVPSGGAEQRQTLARRPGGLEASGRLDWHAVGLELEPGDELELWIETVDNDTVSGPKVGKSAVRRIRVRSARDVHRQLLAELGVLLDEMLGTLSVTLTGERAALPSVQTLARGEVGIFRAVARIEEGIDARIGKHVEDLHGILRRLWDDPLGSSATYETLSTMYLRLKDQRAEKRSLLTREAPALNRPYADEALLAALNDLRDDEIAELETDCLSLDDLLYQERADELRHLAEQILRDQEKLTGLLEEYARTGDPATLAEAERLLDRMERRLAELQGRMAELGSAAMEEFINLDALKGAMGPNASAALEELSQSLAAGDIEAAQQRSADLLKSLQRTMAALSQDLRGGRSLAGSSLFAQAQQAVDRLQSLVKAQGKLVGDTDVVQREVDARRFGSEDPAEFFAREQERAQGVVEDLQAGLAALEADPEFAALRETMNQLRNLESDVRDSLQRGASLEELERRHAAMFALREKFAEQDSGRRIEAFETANEALEQARQAQLALGARELDEALRQARRLQGRLGDRGALGGRGDGAQAVPSEVGGFAIAKELSRELLKNLEALDAVLEGSAADNATRADASRMQDFARRQRNLKSEAGEIEQELAELGSKSTDFPPDLPDRLRQAGQYMELASRALDGQDVDDGLRNEREAQSRLEEALQQTQQSAESCAGGAGGRPKPGGSGSGSGFAFVPGGVSGPPRFRDQGGSGDRQRQLALFGRNDGEVEIPGAAQALGPEEFRRDILEGMKEPRPSDYQDAIDSYYRELTR